ncbi:MAG: hypothetical protein A2826_02520 [Candidatus Doudnabacteria bacterium RIFCSPHIGHO2_01_FULL_43_23]|uniref:Uncharacterized protein n=1 Tax=Candidatus Doudnabacteria bacterium RIFCSPHIGHO2_01_FULL_43_23 TaxID=1817822 RepID=A0A1F5NW75_9BACT|nr:MAG: hypothetical protein A2826_02520 [Candidatus Doudnabacteria bacterium RIFCSPHIGHO2_01_FULL_43_23]
MLQGVMFVPRPLPPGESDQIRQEVADIDNERGYSTISQMVDQSERRKGQRLGLTPEAESSPPDP